MIKMDKSTHKKGLVYHVSFFINENYVCVGIHQCFVLIISCLLLKFEIRELDNFCQFSVGHARARGIGTI